jgi:hypothetical protein
LIKKAGLWTPSVFSVGQLEGTTLSEQNKALYERLGGVKAAQKVHQ